MSPVTGEVYVKATATPKVGFVPEIQVNGQVVQPAIEQNPDIVDDIRFFIGDTDIAAPHSKTSEYIGAAWEGGYWAGYPLSCTVRWKSHSQDGQGKPLWPDGEHTLTARGVAGASTQDEDLTVTVKNKVSLSGTVTDAATGEPIAGAMVTVKREHVQYIGPPEPTSPAPDAPWEEWDAYMQAYNAYQQAYNDPANWEDQVFARATTGETGGFAFELYPHDYTLMVRHGEYVTHRQPITLVPAGEHEVPIALQPRFTLTISPDPAELEDPEGTVLIVARCLDEEGRPVEGQDVNFGVDEGSDGECGDSPSWGVVTPDSGVTDTQGEVWAVYSTGTCAGTAQIWAEPGTEGGLSVASAGTQSWQTAGAGSKKKKKPVRVKARELSNYEWGQVRKALSGLSECLPEVLTYHTNCFDFPLHRIHVDRGRHNRNNFLVLPSYQEFAKTTWHFPYSLNSVIRFGQATKFNDLTQLVQTLVHEYIHVSIGPFDSEKVEKEKCPNTNVEMLIDEAAWYWIDRYRDCLSPKLQ